MGKGPAAQKVVTWERCALGQDSWGHPNVWLMLPKQDLKVTQNKSF